MGLFDFITGKKSLGPWQAEARKLKDDEWEYENAKSRALIEKLFAQAAPAFGNGQVKDVPEDRTVDLRGTWDGAPIRFCVRLWWRYHPEIGPIETMSRPDTSTLHITRDPKKIPKARSGDDPWAREEEIRVFIAKGIFVRGNDQDIAENLSTWSRFPAPVQERVLAEMERLDISNASITARGVSLFAGSKLPDLADPIEYMQSCARLLMALKSGVPKGAVESADAAASAAKATRLACKYCSSLFVLAPDKSTCPNCGAPATK